MRSKRRAEDLIDRIQASGQTNIYPALATAWRMLQNIRAKRKHVILLSDGDTAPADFERLLKRMRTPRSRVSTVTIGRTGDPELMAQDRALGQGQGLRGRGRSSRCRRSSSRTRTACRRPTLIEEPFRPVVKRKIEALRGLDFAARAAAARVRQHQAEGWRGGVPGDSASGARSWCAGSTGWAAPCCSPPT